MGEVESQEKPKKPDRLAEAIVKKVEDVKIDDRELKVHKWNLHTSLELMGTLGDILKQMISSVGPQMDIMSLLQRDVGQLLAEHEENIVKILVGSVTAGNFINTEEAEDWIRGLGAGDALKLFAIIARQNIRPLVEAVGEIAKEIGVSIRGNVDAAQKESQQQTS